MAEDALQKYLGEGWFPVEHDGQRQWAWSGKKAVLRLPSVRTGCHELEIDGGAVSRISVVVMHNGTRLFSRGESLEAAVIHIPAGVATCTLEAEKVWRPQQDTSEDPRLLGVCLHRVEYLPDPSGRYGEVCADFPRMMEIGLTSMCNINPPCIMCPSRNRAHRKPEGHLSAGIIDNVKPYLNLSGKIALHGIQGEPLLSPRLFDLLRSLDNGKTQLEFITNGILLTEETSRKLIQSGLTRINVSLDAASAKTYATIRRQDRFSEIVGNIRRLQGLKASSGSKTPDVIINMVLMKANLKELPAFIGLAQELEVSTVHVRLLDPIDSAFEASSGEFYGNYLEQKVDSDSKIFADTVAEAYRTAVRSGVSIFCNNPEILAIFQQEHGADPRGLMPNSLTITIDGPTVEKNFVFTPFVPACTMPWHHCLVGMDGDMYFCCLSRSKLGNINDEMFPYTFIWNGERARSVRREFLNNRIPEGCRMCPYLLPQQSAWKAAGQPANGKDQR